MLKLENLYLTLGNFKLKDVNLEINQGEYCVLLGESGSGKSVILSTIAGLYKPDKGQIILNNRNITNAKIQNRNVGLLFQDYALFPHLNVFENIAFPLKMHKAKSQTIGETVMELAVNLEIEHLLHRRIRALSGGEKQRVALARILALNPKVLLLDEPLSALDVGLRYDLRNLLKKINKRGISIFHVTHDFDEAISLADKIAVIQSGEIVQHGSSEEVFRNPNSTFVAKFAGIKNIFPCQVINQTEAVTSNGLNIKFQNTLEASTPSMLLLRGEDIIVSNQKQVSSALNNFEGTVMEMNINQYGVQLSIDAGENFICQISMESTLTLDIKVGRKVCLSFKSNAVKLL